MYDKNANYAGASLGNISQGLKPPAPPTQTGNAIESVRNEITLAAELVATLRTRLGVVLRNEPESDKSECRAVQSYGVELAEQIGNQAYRVECVNDVLRDILRRLEV